MDPQSMNDHDLLITIHEQVKGVRKDMASAADGYRYQLNDHETRIRMIEKWTWKLIGMVALAEAVLGFYVAFIKK